MIRSITSFIFNIFPTTARSVDSMICTISSGKPDDAENVAPLVAYLCTEEAPNANGYVFGARGGSIYLYSNPEIERNIYKADIFTMDELDELVPEFLSYDMPREGDPGARSQGGVENG